MKIGTRTSALARWQTDDIIARLQAAWPDLTCDIVTFVTRGDTTLDQPLPQIGGKGLFTLELEHALRDGAIDIAVHSLKDLPVDQPDGLTLGAIVGRADVRDVLVAKHGLTLGTLPFGATVGTSSLRRKAQLLAARPDLDVQSIRGNVETRIRKALETDAYAATVLAAAGVTRLGLDAHIAQYLPLDVMLPAPGQGALAVQCRADDAATLALLAALDNADVRACVDAERAFLNALGGGCATPVAAHATCADGVLQLTGLVAAVDGAQEIVVRGSGRDAARLGRRLADKALARGAQALLNPPSAPSPLSGKRILVTRSAAQSADFAARLAARGAEPVVFPVITFDPLPTAPLHAALAQTPDWVVFTSGNAVDFYFAAADAPPSGARIAAVGSATAEKLAARGVAVDFLPDEFTGEQLAQGLGDVRGQRVLLPRAKIGRPEIVALLQEQGATVDDVPLYDTVTATPTAAALADLRRGVDVITFTSPSSVRNFVAIVGDAAPAALIACIGPSTAAEAQQFGFAVAIQPADYTIDALIDAIATHYA